MVPDMVFNPEANLDCNAGASRMEDNLFAMRDTLYQQQSQRWSHASGYVERESGGGRTGAKAEERRRGVGGYRRRCRR